MASRVEYLKRFISLLMCVFYCLEATRPMHVVVNGGHQNLTLTHKEKFEVNFYFVDAFLDGQNIMVYVQHRRPGETVFHSKCVLQYFRENCTSTTTLCRCSEPASANYSLSKVFTEDDAGTWVVTRWIAQNQVTETVDIIVEENTRESTLSTVIIAIVSLVSLAAVVSMSFLFLWCWSRFFVKTVPLVVMASADTPSDCFHRESTFHLRKSRDISNICSKTLPAAALPETVTPLSLPELIAESSPSVRAHPSLPALLPPAPSPTTALSPQPLPKVPPPTPPKPPPTTLSKESTSAPQAPLLPTPALSPEALSKVPPPTPPKPPLQESASGPHAPPLPTTAQSPQALSKVPPPTPPKPPPATTSMESASTPQPPTQPTPEPSPVLVSASTDSSILKLPNKIYFSL